MGGGGGGGSVAEGAGWGGRGARRLHRGRHVAGAGPAGNVRARFGAEGGGDAAGSGMVATRWWLHSALPDLRDHRAAGGAGEYDEEIRLDIHTLHYNR